MLARKSDKKQIVRVKKKSLAGSRKASAGLVRDLRSLIEQTREAVGRSVNSALVVLYWQVGRRIRKDILKEGRAEYGREIVQTVSAQLVADYGGGFETTNLRRMIQFAEVFPEEEIVAALSRQLSWSHFREIIPFHDDLQREFYAEMCRIERWSVRTLRKKISGMLFERTAISKKPAELAKQELADLREGDRLTPDLVFRDPYFLDFLGLKAGGVVAVFATTFLSSRLCYKSFVPKGLQNRSVWVT